MLREAALAIVEAIDIRGACNVQFALHPTDSRYAVIEINPRLSRFGACLQASGYPIAKVATRIALGYRLDEILNEITGTETALFRRFSIMWLPKFLLAFRQICPSPSHFGYADRGSQGGHVDRCRSRSCVAQGGPLS